MAKVRGRLDSTSLPPLLLPSLSLSPQKLLALCLDAAATSAQHQQTRARSRNQTTSETAHTTHTTPRVKDARALRPPRAHTHTHTPHHRRPPFPSLCAPEEERDRVPLPAARHARAPSACSLASTVPDPTLPAALSPRAAQGWCVLLSLSRSRRSPLSLPPSSPASMWGRALRPGRLLLLTCAHCLCRSMPGRARAPQHDLARRRRRQPSGGHSRALSHSPPPHSLLLFFRTTPSNPPPPLSNTGDARALRVGLGLRPV